MEHVPIVSESLKTSDRRKIRMENLLDKVIEETTDQEVKAVAQSIATLDLTPEGMEANLIASGHFVLSNAHDKQN